MESVSDVRSRPASGRDFRVGTVPDDLSELFVEERAVPRAFRPGKPIEQDRILLSGGLRPWTGPADDVFSPVEIRTPAGLSPRRLGSLPRMTGRDALAVLAAARQAFAEGRGAWSGLPFHLRVRGLEDFARRLRALKEPVVRTLMWEIAKPHAELENEFDRTIESFGLLVRTAEKRDRASRSLIRQKGVLGLVRNEPRGVALCAGPYNYPLFETFGLVVPALLAGNAVIVKPPRFGALFFDLLLDSLAAAFPPGTVHVLSGDGRTLLEPLMRSGGVDVFAFIGSQAVADRMIGLHPKKTRLRTLLGLGAKNAAVILPDADLDVAVRECLLGALAFNGQRCAALKILFVHEAVRKPFLERLAGETDKVAIGLPWERGVRVTPLTDPARGPYLRALLADAAGRGAGIVNKNGGRSVGSFFCPAVLHPVTSRMRIFREEQFGPLVPVVPFRKAEEPVAALRASPFGQQASVFGADLRTLGPLVDALRSQVARVNLNSKCQRGPDLFPFTGKKDSARGDFSAAEILGFFSDRTVVAAREDGPGPDLLRKYRKSARAGTAARNGS